MRPGCMVIEDPREGRAPNGARKFALRRMILQMILALIRESIDRVAEKVIALRHDGRAVAVAVMEIKGMTDLMRGRA